MGAFTSVLERILPLEGPYPLTAARLIEAMSGPTSITGKQISPQNALGSAAVFSCVRVLTDSVGQLPCPLYRRVVPRGKERATDHPLYAVLNDQPNPWMTPFTFKETVMGHVLLWGNAFCEIERDANGRVTALWPLRPSNMHKIEKAADGSLLYTYQTPGGDLVQIPQSRMLHLRGLSNDGILGYSPITLHREALGLAIAAEEYGARFFGNSARPSGVLQTKARLSQPAADRLRESWNSAHQGLTNAHRIAVLEEGVEWQAIGIPPNDAQFLETRQFQLTEISRIFRVPPHKISDLNRATYSNVDKQEVQFRSDTLSPWLVRFEEQLSLSLLTPAERRTYIIEFLMDAQWRSDILTRYSAYAYGKQWGFLSTNDIRAYENLNPIADGDDYWQPVNMGVVGAMPVPADSAASQLPADANSRMQLDALLRDVTSLKERVGELDATAN